MSTQRDLDSRVKVKKKFNHAVQDHIRHTFLSAGGSTPLAYTELQPAGKPTFLTELHQECFYNQSNHLFEAVRALLNRNPDDIHQKDSIGLSPLHLLCGFNGSNCLVETLENMLQSGANVKSGDLRGYTPLHYLCYNTVIEADTRLRSLTVLLRYGAEINAKESRIKATPLHILCNYCTNEKLDEILAFFVLHGANLHARTIENRTALHCICRSNRSPYLLDAITILVRHGADANARDDRNMTALHEVCHRPRPDILKPAIEQLLSTKATCVNVATIHKRTALHFLALYYHCANLPEFLTLLIAKYGADVNQGDEKQRSPLHYLLEHNRSPSWVDAVGVMIRNGADVNARSKSRRNALMHACLNFYQTPLLPEVIKILTESGVCIKDTDGHQRNVLHFLTLSPGIDTSRCISILASQLDCDVVDAVSLEGTCALTLAARLGCIGTLKQLIPIAKKNPTDAFHKNVLDYLEELKERKAHPLCSCCQTNATLELPSAMVKQLRAKKGMFLAQTDKFNLGDLEALLLDKSSYGCYEDENTIVKPPSAKWLEFCALWRDPSQMYVFFDGTRLKNLIRDVTHPCRQPSLVPMRRNKCFWCDVAGSVYSYVKLLADKIGSIDPRFRTSSIVPYGSLAEGTRLFAPDGHHFAVVLADWFESADRPLTVRYAGNESTNQFNHSSSQLISASRLNQHYHALVRMAASWVRRFEIFEHWSPAFDDFGTVLFLVHRSRNLLESPIRVTVSITLTVNRASGNSHLRSNLPSWCRVAERDCEAEYLKFKPSGEGWNVFYPALERDSLRYAGSVVTQVHHLIKLLLLASETDEHDRMPKQTISSFALKTCLLTYMELNPPPWKSTDVILHSMGVLDILLEKHDFSLSFFDDKERLFLGDIPMFTPIPFETKRIVYLIKYKLSFLLNDRHHSFTI